MLKSELMAPASVDESKTPDQLSAKQEMADKAAASLQASLTALGPGLLDQSVLNDVAVEDLMQYLGLVNPPWARKSGSSDRSAAAEGGGSQEHEGWHLPQRAQRRLACIASCVAAVRTLDHCFPVAKLQWLLWFLERSRIRSCWTMAGMAGSHKAEPAVAIVLRGYQQYRQQVPNTL
jgi:hypothetical protein